MPLFLYKYGKYVLLAALIYMPVFGHLDTLPIRIWDESRLAINAYEMQKDGDFIVTHFNGNPDDWNTKPPFLIWIQALFMKFFGINELAVRLPSAIAVLLTCAAILIFSIKYFKNFWFGFSAILILITSQGYIHTHSGRTGDYDAMLTLFTTLSALLFYAYCETSKYKFLYLFFLFLALAVLTKSISGLLFLPAFLIYTLIRKKIYIFLSNKHFYFGFLGFVFIVVGYYLLREIKSPGYLDAVQRNELGGRFLEVIEEHQNYFWYYYDNLIDLRFNPYYFLLPLGFIIGLFVKEQRINRFTQFLFLLIICYFIIISSAQTKLEWYDVPLFPFLAMMASIFIYYAYKFFKNFSWFNETLNYNILPFLFLFSIFLTPYQNIIAETYKPKEAESAIDFYAMSHYLQDAVKGKYNLNNQYLVHDGYNAHLLFYLNILNDKGIAISFKDWQKLEPNDIVIASQNVIKDKLKSHYDFEVLKEDGSVSTYKIVKKKEEQ